jgi:superfamily II DNA or RNA helicase
MTQTPIKRNQNKLIAPGDLVEVRGRSWVYLGTNQGLITLRPTSGADRSVIGISERLEGQQVKKIQHQAPHLYGLGEPKSALPIYESAKLSGYAPALPFRSLGRVRFQPKPYQLVPLAMALRQDGPVRIMIADGVGVGKTIEACLIASELLERGRIDGLTVLCPSHLCDQWSEELIEKFGIRAEVVRPSNIGELERRIPREGESVFAHYKFTIASIDYVKSDRYISSLLENAPGLVIVDEAHTASRPGGTVESDVQKRFRLVRKLADDPSRNLILVTATPHSGVEDSYRSLLGLINKEWDVDSGEITTTVRNRIRRQLVQRGRADLREWLGTDTPFPVLEAKEISYTLSRSQLELSEKIAEYCRGSGSSVRRMGHWGTLALMRSALSSPAAAVAAFESRMNRVSSSKAISPSGPLFDILAADEVGDPSDTEAWHDSVPSNALADSQGSTSDDKPVLTGLISLARKTSGQARDGKLESLIELVTKSLDEKQNPIIFCRYVATAEYVANEIESSLVSGYTDLKIGTITGRVAEELRIKNVRELGKHKRRILVATDCMSEGVNLQDHFDAVIHYDLPWNPMRLQQREGRVDRFGQPKSTVQAIVMNGVNSEIDQTVMQVLMRKYRQIQKDMGGTVAIPEDSERSVTEELINRVVGAQQTESGIQATFGASESLLHAQWDQAAAAHASRSGQYRNGGLDPEDLDQLVNSAEDILGSTNDSDSLLNWLSEIEVGSTESPLPWDIAPKLLKVANGPSSPENLRPYGYGMSDEIEKRLAFAVYRFRHTVTESNEVNPCEEIVFVRLRINGGDSGVVEARVLPPQEAMNILENALPKHDSSIEAIVTNNVGTLEKNSGWSTGIQQELALKLARTYGYITSTRRKPPEIATRVPDLLALYLIDPVSEGDADGR